MMTRTKLALLAFAVAALLAVPTVAFANGMKGEVELHQIKGSHITGEIEMDDDGGKLTITGEAEGLTPGGFYVSLIYDAESRSRGPLACEPIIPFGEEGDIEATMLIGVWAVDQDGEGTLGPIENILPTPGFPPGPAVYVPLDLIGTVSIRDGNADFALVACGDVETDD